MEVNMNTMVRVKLTSEGLRELKIQDNNYYARFPYAERVKYVPPEIDAFGYSKFQLWDLMNKFGHKMAYPGATLMFETNIIVEVKKELIEPNGSVDMEELARRIKKIEEKKMNLSEPMIEVSIMGEIRFMSVHEVKYIRLPSSFEKKMYLRRYEEAKKRKVDLITRDGRYLMWSEYNDRS